MAQSPAPSEHQDYIQFKLNPILENLVTQLLLERPESVAPFMITWLTEHATTPAARRFTEGVNELEELKAELKSLQAEVEKLESEVDAPAASKGEKIDEEEDEEADDDDDDVEEMPMPEAYLKKGPRASVSAEAYGAWNKREEFKTLVHTKSDEKKKRINGVLTSSFLFSELDVAALGVLIDAMQEKCVDAGTKIINQGDDGDCLFVIEEGQIDCFKKQADGSEKLVKECTAGEAFGELALLYNCPRAASVVAHTQCILWQLDRESFNHIVRDAAAKRRERYEDFLKGVPLLQSMDAYDRSKLSDVLRHETILEGTTIVKQGEAGDRFYMIEEGEAFVEKVYVSGTPATKVHVYKTGDYFGELALIRNEPRAATVIAQTECRLLSLSRKTFKQLLGSLEEILTKNATLYK